MKTPNEIVEELIKTGFVKNYLRKRAIGWPIEDLEQDIYLILLEYPLLSELYRQGGINKVRQVTSGVIVRHISEKGKGWRNYKREIKYTDEEIPEIGYEQKQNVY